MNPIKKGRRNSIIIFFISFFVFNCIWANEKKSQCETFLNKDSQQDSFSPGTVLDIKSNPYGASFRPSALFSVKDSNSRVGERFFLPYLGWKLFEGTSFEKNFGFLDRFFTMNPIISIGEAHHYPTIGFLSSKTPSDTLLHVMAYSGGLLDKTPSQRTLKRFGPTIYADPITNNIIEIASKYDHIILSPKDNFSLGDLIRNGEHRYFENSDPMDSYLSYFKETKNASLKLNNISIVRDSATGVQAYLLGLTYETENIDNLNRTYVPFKRHLQILLPPSFDRSPMSELFFSLFIPRKSLFQTSNPVPLMTEDLENTFPGWKVPAVQDGQSLSYWLDATPFSTYNLVVHPGVSDSVGKFRSVSGHISTTISSFSMEEIKLPLIPEVRKKQIENSRWSEIQDMRRKIINNK